MFVGLHTVHVVYKFLKFVCSIYVIIFFSDLMTYLESVENEKVIVDGASSNDPAILRRSPVNSKYV